MDGKRTFSYPASLPRHKGRSKAPLAGPGAPPNTRVMISTVIPAAVEYPAPASGRGSCPGGADYSAKYKHIPPTKVGKWKSVNVVNSQPAPPALPFKQYQALASPVPLGPDVYELWRVGQSDDLHSAIKGNASRKGRVFVRA